MIKEFENIQIHSLSLMESLLNDKKKDDKKLNNFNMDKNKKENTNNKQIEGVKNGRNKLHNPIFFSSPRN